MPESDSLLNRIDSPADLRRLAPAELPRLAAEIRRLLLEVISANGGHLSSNLGVVELTIALHYVFNTPEDKILWDVGHQSYVHKILTGRREQFRSLRCYGGCCGFQSRRESPFDDFGAGHAGTAISAAQGMATALDRQGVPGKAIAVVGDGALSCGISMEALNNAANGSGRLIVILNDNKMSISENIGSMRNYLNCLISGRVYNRLRTALRDFLHRALPGHKAYRCIQRFEEKLKSLILPGGVFDGLGFRYIGPIDGHSLPRLLHTLHGIKEYNQPLLIHVITRKGHGYIPAEQAPDKFHGVGPFDLATGRLRSNGKLTFSKAFGAALEALAARHDDVVGITAAMAGGTGMGGFAERFPKRFFDVGIAEEHAVVFAAGQACSGLRPVVAIYATFMQRALDCVYHDVCLQNLPVIFALDRAGIVEDGPTHHGIYDLSFFRTLPNLTILAPRDENELYAMLFWAYDRKAPVLIRYPRGGSGRDFRPLEPLPTPLENGRAEVVRAGEDGVIWALGAEVDRALRCAEILAEKYQLDCGVVNVRFLLPFDAARLKEQAARQAVFTLEDHRLVGGLASAVAETLLNEPHGMVEHFGWAAPAVGYGAAAALRREAGLIPEQLAERMAALLRQKR